ncbi:DNA-3-methyladenine glycosylase I [Bifidobacterium sp. ESL0790]|uniref:DNA-3-methyladenine glycosylase I n=1 Tax=Bifidobacterium sp. ESL0790 TaxID=2983233 RepID=UPI0023F7D7D7|nr:DNA-3-methyladenine glycosylase I [Bifidobacterium sp. ESL0790]WEV71759.1 DNA-3-methyladenine glycosylase I [Bifidobacterium sp. ESL0790]
MSKKQQNKARDAAKAGNAKQTTTPAATPKDNPETVDRSLPRCWPIDVISPLMAEYHDHEWGVPCHDSQQLFERLGLEAMQAGLSWNTVLNKRESIDKAFYDFDIERVAAMTPEIPELLKNKAIIRNRRKIEAIIHNAQVVLSLDEPFADYIWQFAPDGPKVNRPNSWDDVPVTTPQAEKMSKRMKKDGFKFVGPTIIYAYMQSIGMVNDHAAGCFCCA